MDLEPASSRFCLFSIKFSPDSNEILGGSSDRSIYIYNLDRREVALRMEAHRDDVNTVSYGEDSNNNMIISGSDDFLCKVWDRRVLGRERNVAVGAFMGHTEGVTHVSSKGDGRYFISNGKDHVIKLWDIRKMADPSTAENHPRHSSYDYRHGMFFPPREEQRHPHDGSLMTYRGHTVCQTLIRSYFSPMATTGQKFIYTGSYDGKLFIYDVVSGARVATLANHRATIRDATWHPYRNEIVTASWDGSTQLWEPGQRDRQCCCRKASCKCP
eukprot:TRINITY_DN6512_c0_g1_i2.p1 TRINITY_DN6512_c0_g1~~TRINITY_DN6512_c0_g1_i2.p1  ORF type:complete len:271 (-),score=62.18 TRINITY_DN6512_c0_g1_i2:31-843(-)